MFDKMWRNISVNVSRFLNIWFLLLFFLYSCENPPKASHEDDYFEVTPKITQIENMGDFISADFKGQFTNSQGIDLQGHVFVKVIGGYNGQCTAKEEHEEFQMVSGTWDDKKFYFLNFNFGCDEINRAYDVYFKVKYSTTTGDESYEIAATPITIIVGYPCIRGMNDKTYKVQHDRMKPKTGFQDYDFTYGNNQIQSIMTAYLDSKITLTINTTNTSNNYEEFDAQNDPTKLITIMRGYSDKYWDRDNSDGYLGSIKTILNFPSTNDVDGVCIPGAINDDKNRPAFVFCYNMSDSYKLNRIVAHELGHQRGSWGHDSHSNNGECCILQSSVLPSGCNSSTLLYFCSNHKCLINIGH